MQKNVSIFTIWWWAIRPRTLPAAFSGVISALAMTIFYEGKLLLIPALASFAVAVLLQIASNLANDVFDFENGVDTANRIGPTRVTQSGLLKPQTVKVGMTIVIFLALIVGLYLASISTFHLLWFGVLAIVCAVQYTAGPYPLGYYGFGDVTVWFFFGPVCVVGTYFIQTGNINLTVFLISVIMGLLITAILVVNNLRDYEEDIRAGKKTLAVRFGKNFCKVQYSFCTLSFVIINPLLVFNNMLPSSSLVTILAILFLIKPLRLVYTQEGKILNLALAQTGKVAIIYSLLLLFGVNYKSIINLGL